MPGIYVVKFFAMIHSKRVCAGGRVLACAHAYHPRGVVFCKGSLYKSFEQEGEFSCLLMPGIYVEVFCSGSLYKSCVQEGEFWRVLMLNI
jgi:hypothetical protein